MFPPIGGSRSSSTRSTCPPARSVGCWQQPDGAALYARSTRYHTTTKLTPDEIHAIGLKEVDAHPRRDGRGHRSRSGSRARFQEFFAFLRTDPQFYCKTPEELLRALCAPSSKRIDPELVKLFRTLPRTPYGVEPIPTTIAPDTTTAYYQPARADGSRAGYYFVNLYEPEARPKWEMEVLTLHEAVPGHHLQIALAQEQADLPKFRRNAELHRVRRRLGALRRRPRRGDGPLHDPYAKFGQLTYDMWRAVRLVVDTGIHAKHWTRQQAIDYFKANAAKTEARHRQRGRPLHLLARAGARVQDRPAQDPGAARAQAQQELGARFDIREFHDVVLSTAPCRSMCWRKRSTRGSTRNSRQVESCGSSPERGFAAMKRRSNARYRRVVGLTVAGGVRVFRRRARRKQRASSKLQQAERQRFTALTAQNLAALDPLLADELLYCHSNGQVENKQQLLETIRTGRDSLRVDRRARIPGAPLRRASRRYGLHRRARAASAAKPMTLELRYTDVYTWRAGHWQLINWQSTRIAAAPH